MILNLLKPDKIDNVNGEHDIQLNAIGVSYQKLFKIIIIFCEALRPWKKKHFKIECERNNVDKGRREKVYFFKFKLNPKDVASITTIIALQTLMCFFKLSIMMHLREFVLTWVKQWSEKIIFFHSLFGE